MPSPAKEPRTRFRRSAALESYATCQTSNRGNRRSRRRIEVELTGTVAKLPDVVESERMESREHHVGHRRALPGRQVQAAPEMPSRVTGQEQRAVPVVVNVRIPH